MPTAGSRRARAIEVGRLLEAEGVEHYEEPCPYWELEQTKEVAEALDVAVTGGEQDCELATWRRICELPAVDIVQPDILYVGGIGRTLRIARMAAARGLPVTPHAANLGLVTLFTMHLLPTLAQRRQVPRILDRGGRLLSLAIRPVPQRSLPGVEGRSCDRAVRARLGCRDRPGMAGEVGVPGERAD